MFFKSCKEKNSFGIIEGGLIQIGYPYEQAELIEKTNATKFLRMEGNYWISLISLI